MKKLQDLYKNAIHILHFVTSVFKFQNRNVYNGLLTHFSTLHSLLPHKILYLCNRIFRDNEAICLMKIVFSKYMYLVIIKNSSCTVSRIRHLAPNFRRFDSFLAPNFRRFNPFLAPNFRKIRIFAPDYQRVTNYEKISKKTYRQRT